jgi:hypothetical protein
MSIEEYERYFQELTMSFGSSYMQPSGADRNGLYFSCAKPPIYVPYPENLTAEQRRIVVERAAQQYAFPYIAAE